MPTFEISDGTGRYQVTAPDENAAFEAFRGMSAPAAPEKPGLIADIAGGVQGGVIRGAAGMAGLPGFAVSGLEWAADRAARQTVGRAVNYFRGNGFVPDETPAPETAASAFAPSRVLPQPQDAIKAVEGVIGPTYRPQTTAGQYAASVGEMVGGGLRAGPAIAAGVLSEGAGQATAGTALEPWARAGGAIVGGVGASMLGRPNSAGQAISNYAEGLTPAQVDAAEALMREAAGRGVQLTRAEAVQQVTGGASRLGDLQRLVEGRGELRPFMAERPAQVEAAGRAQFDAVAPVTRNPSAIGPQIGRAAEQEVAATQGNINAATRPLYQAAETQRVGPQINAGLMSDPLYARTLQEVRSNPALNATIAQMPDDAVGVIDLVQRRLREQAENARMPGQANSSNLAAANMEAARTPAIAAADTVTGSAPGVMGSYEMARAAQEQLREQVLAPLMAGPIGRLAQRDITTQNAVNALFPKNPVPNSAGEVLDAVTALSRRAPEASRQLVRAHLESQFNRATRDLQGGANQFGGANFAAAVRGNPQEAANLAAAIQGLPNGVQILPGFDRFLDIMAATGQRQRAGSLTAYNAEALNELKKGGIVGTGLATAAGAGTQLPRRVLERFQQWSLGQNTQEIARILTDPAAAPLFRHLATAQPGTARTNAILGRLVSMAGTGSTAAERSRQPVP